MFRVIIAGSRNFNDFELLEKKMLYFLQNKKNIVVLCGGAKGADDLGRQFAEKHNFMVELFPADWKKHGKRAGVIRNRQMAETASACVCFWNGQSKGTANMIEEAKRAGLPLRVVRF
jgi:hypothetical protein